MAQRPCDMAYDLLKREAEGIRTLTSCLPFPRVPSGNVAHGLDSAGQAEPVARVGRLRLDESDWQSLSPVSCQVMPS